MKWGKSRVTGGDKLPRLRTNPPAGMEGDPPGRTGQTLLIAALPYAAGGGLIAVSWRMSDTANRTVFLAVPGFSPKWEYTVEENSLRGRFFLCGEPPEKSVRRNKKKNTL